MVVKEVCPKCGQSDEVEENIQYVKGGTVKVKKCYCNRCKYGWMIDGKLEKW